MGVTGETTCPKCKSKLKLIERSWGFPGGKDKEQAYCPVCHYMVDEIMTDGTYDAILIEKNEDWKPEE